MADGIEQDAPETVVEATNKGLSEFLTEKVKGYESENTETNNEILGDGKEKAEADDKVEKEVSDSNIELDADGKPIEKVDGKDKVEEKEGDKEVPPVDKEKEQGEPEPGKPVPYERFKEVNEKRTQVEETLKQAQPKIENFDRITQFCAQNQIQPEQFEKAMQIQALLNTDPAEALKQILPIVEQLQGFVGDKIPKDLQDKVDNGKMELDDAKEMAKLRAQTQFKDAMSKRNGEQTQKQRQEQEMQVYTHTAKEWETKQRETDPDYKPKANETATDGLWEDVRDKYQALLTATDMRGVPLNPVRNPQEMVGLMNKAYKACKDKWTNGIRRDPSRKTLPKNGESRPGSKNTVENAKTMHEAVQARLAERQR